MEISVPRSIFADRGFALYYAGQSFSFVGDGFRMLAIPLLVFHLTGSALSIAITYALQGLPFALGNLIGGSLGDRLDRRRLMIVCDFVRFSVVALFAIGYARGFLTLPLLYTGIAVLSFAAAIFVGGEIPSIGYLLGPDRSHKAVAALIAGEQSANLVAPPIGGILFSIAGPLPALVVNAATYLMSQVSIAFVPTLGPDVPGSLPSMRDLLSDIRAGFTWLWADSALRAIALMSFSLNALAMMAVAIYIPYIKVLYGATDAQVGFSLGAASLGAVGGSLLAGHMGRRWPFGRALCIAYVIDGLVFLPVIFAQHLWIVVMAWAVAAGLGAFEIALIIGWRMRVVPQDVMGRVLGAVRLVAVFGMVPGSIAGGWLADHYGLRVPMIASAFGFAAIAAASWLFPALREENR